MPAVLLWIIANPTSGHGSGRSQVEKLCRAIHLSTSFSASASTDTANKERIEVHAPKEWSATQFNKLLRWDSDGSSAATNGASPLFDETLWASLSALFGVSKDVWVNAFTPDGLQDDSVTQLCTAVVLTEASQDGMRIAQLVGSAAQRSRCYGPYGGATSGERLIHLVATVGGDGTLSEVVNGLSNGVLAACGQNSCLNETGTSTFFGIQRERALLRHLLPPLIYIPGGTGADFAKLNLCCRTTDEFLTVLFGATSQLVSASSQTSPNFPSFATYEVDIGRITFPKTGRSHFFINECSIGMSCDVIERGEAYKTNPILSALGGTAIFASASFVSLLHMRPHLIRMARLPPPPQLPSDLLPPATTSTEPMTDNRGPSFLVDVQTRIADNLHQPQVVDAWTAPPVGDAGMALQQDLSALVGIRLSVEQQNQRSGLDPHEYYHYYQDASELPVLHPSAASGATEAVEVSPRTARQLYTQPSRAAVMGKRSGIVAEDAAPRVLKPAEVRGALDSSTICRQGHSATSQLVDWAYFMSSTVAFGNGRWYGGGMHVTPHADPTDGLVSCTNWVATFLPFVFGATALYNGRHVRWRNTSTWDGARFLVDVGPSAKPGDSGNRERMFMEADGELLEELPAVVEMGGSIVFLSPTQARFGQPLPGTARATTQLDRSSPTEDDSSPSTRRRWCGRLSSLFSRGRRQRE